MTLTSQKPCTLFCSPVGRDIPVLMSERVMDGTPCGPYEADLCVNGRCQVKYRPAVFTLLPQTLFNMPHLPFDISSLGSVSDHCGMCNGDGRSCKIVRGDFNHTKGMGNDLNSGMISSFIYFLRKYLGFGAQCQASFWIAVESRRWFIVTATTFEPILTPQPCFWIAVESRRWFIVTATTFEWDRTCCLKSAVLLNSGEGEERVNISDPEEDEEENLCLSRSFAPVPKLKELRRGPLQSRAYSSSVLAPSVYEDLASPNNRNTGSLQDSNKRSINSDWKIELPGEFQLAGTTVRYVRRGLWEKMSARGPTNSPLHLMTYGIHYEYTVSVNVSRDRGGREDQRDPENLYIWTHSSWQDCTVQCGGGSAGGLLDVWGRRSGNEEAGERRTVVSCMRIANKTMELVNSSHCQPQSQPPPQAECSIGPERQQRCLGGLLEEGMESGRRRGLGSGQGVG
ncbi:hypothetical protein CRUP_011438 [Coryphaenoides rupestris]|nr:hypothetical protein CRUP_011438 [Coryphaenoides rupestris]